MKMMTPLRQRRQNPLSHCDMSIDKIVRTIYILNSMHNNHAPELGNTIAMFLEKKAAATGTLKFRRKRVVQRVPSVSGKLNIITALGNISVDASAN
jgi:hypothetical protein